MFAPPVLLRRMSESRLPAKRRVLSIQIRSDVEWAGVAGSGVRPQAASVPARAVPARRTAMGRVG
jgi:hypothetical protein